MHKSVKNPIEHVVLAAATHPDDIEFMMAGTLLLLKEAGAKAHMWNLSRGTCGSDTLEGDEIARIRYREARASAKIAGAVMQPPVTDDIYVLYEKPLIARTAAVIREIKPTIILLPSPQDYMEDHQNTCRLITTAAFVRGMKNFITFPPVDPWNGNTALYHSMPYGLRDSLRKRIRPGQYVDIGSVLEKKKEMLSMHRSQKEWLDYSQGIGTYLALMESMSKEVGGMSGKFEYAEGWRRHSHWGFAPLDYDPLSDLLTDKCWTDPEYENSLE